MNILPFVQKMKHSPVRNYGGIPGLTSWLLGAAGPYGLVRLMECSRDHQEPIVPHSHRFDFHCVVLDGQVRNLIWERDCLGDEFQETELHYSGEPGEYLQEAGDTAKWSRRVSSYTAGDEYFMTANQVHSIFFSRETSVLFFEAPATSDVSIILQPVVDGVVVPTFKVEDWMFQKGGA